MDTFYQFFSFTDPNVIYVVVGSVLLTGTSAIVGVFTFLRKKALVGDAIAHAVLPGICLAFILSGTKNPFILLVGALITGWISLIFIDLINRYSKIKEDSSIALILAVFFGIGIFLLTIIQKSGNAAQSGLDSFLFGKAAAMVQSDLIAFGIIAAVILLFVILLFKEFTIIAFDKSFASVIGLPVRFVEFILTSLTVLAVVIGIQSVGVVLMAAMLITPAAAARFWSHNILILIILSALFGAFSGLTGAYISYIAPNMPTGPWIVIVISTIAFISFFFAPGKGIIYRFSRRRGLRKKISNENILKALFQLNDKSENGGCYSTEDIINWRSFEYPELKDTLRRLKRQGFVKRGREINTWQLTHEGYSKGKRIVKLHRLWEVYLTKYLQFEADHVHDDAESIEHILTPELEEKLEKLLKYPEIDPHESKIPYL